MGEDAKQSKITAIIEFHGNGLTLTRTEGNCDTARVGYLMGLVYKALYPNRGNGLRLISRKENGTDAFYTLDDPQHFSDFLHLMKNAGDTEVRIKV